MGDADAEVRTGELTADVAGHLGPTDATDKRIGERDGRVHVRARGWTEGQNQRDQASAGRERVREERDRNVPRREALAHDAAADHGCEKQRRRHELGDHASG